MQTLGIIVNDEGRELGQQYAIETQDEKGRRFLWKVNTQININVGDDVKWDKAGLWMVVKQHDEELLLLMETLEGPVRQEKK